MNKERNNIKGLDCMQCPECGAPMPMFMDECMANDCKYNDNEDEEIKKSHMG